MNRSSIESIIRLLAHEDFRKQYSVDLIVQGSIVYELKAVSRLNSEHEMQTLNYLLLLGLQHGKLINFRPPSVEKRFVSTTLLPEDRYNTDVVDREWVELDKDSVRLKQLVIDLLEDWGAYLELNLFYEAICHFWGGENNVVVEIDMFSKGAKIGQPKIHLLNPDLAFKLTALKNGIASYRRHLGRFIRHTTLKGIHWINFNHNVISFETITQ